MEEIIGMGAEATIYRTDNVLKRRLQKPYRIEEIDTALRRTRTRKEAKLLKRLETMDFPAPRLISTDGMADIEMGFIEGPKLRDSLSEENHKEYCEELGQKIAILHNAGIIHGDLTTSNMIVSDEIFFIDFGLSFHSDKPEDKAVDLHLLRQALESKHFGIWESAFGHALESYDDMITDKEVLPRLRKVESRGRNKTKG